MGIRSLLAVFLSIALAAPAVSAPLQQPASKIQVTVVEGEGAINNVRLRRAKEPVVRVEGNGRPVSGAAVVFQLPAQGAGGVFPDGRTSLTVLTDDNGQAIARGLRPTKTSGQFEIRVTASYHGQTASATISQTNAGTAGGTSGKTIGILAGVGAAALGVALAAKGGGGGSRSGPSPPPAGPGATVITPGSPSMGPPQ
jgi:hypothetical protein